MKKFAVLGAVGFLLGGCALPVPVQIASWALDGISYLMTEKSVTDHGISVLAQKDCAVLRGLMEPGEFCREFDDAATDLAEGMPYGNLFDDDETLSAEVAAITGFEGAGAGNAGVSVAALGVFSEVEWGDFSEAGDQAGAPQSVSVSVSVEAAASLVSADLIFEDRTALDAFPQRIDVRTPGEILARQQAALGDVEDLDLDGGRDVAEEVAENEYQNWAARTPRILEIGLEPATGYYFVIGSFRDHANARYLRNQYRVLEPSVLSAKLDEATVYRVVVGPFAKMEKKVVQRKISKAGIADSWAIQVKPGDWRMAMIDPPATAPVEVADVARPEDVREWNAMDYTQMLSRLVY
jgi:hypothetical protein